MRSRIQRTIRRRQRIVSAAALVAIFAATGCAKFPFVPEAEPTREPRRNPQVDVVDGRPLRGRRRRILLPAVRPGGSSDSARAEYASVASFSELALRLMAVGAPIALVEACHRAALEEIGHARIASRLAGEPHAWFGAMPGLLGRRISRRWRSRRAEISSIAVESFLDGWVNEGAAAAALRVEAESLERAEDRAALHAVADEEEGHAALARDIVTWCLDEEPVAVGRALATTPPLRSWEWDSALLESAS